MNKIIVIVGPTGVGKTKLSIELAKMFDAEIINGDSVSIYKSLDIGSAKPTVEERENIPHHLIDIREVSEDYSVFDYQKDVRRLLKEISSRQKNIIIVGGTGLYIKAALYNYQFTISDYNKAYEDLSNEEILNKVLDYSPLYVPEVNNRRRLIRLLNKLENDEVLSYKKDELLYDSIFIGLTCDRDLLYERINNRVDKMIDNGLLDEVNSLKEEFKTSRVLNNGIGYKEFYDYLFNDKDLSLVVDDIKKDSRHLAKRQYTFFNNQFPVKWFNTDFNDFNNTIKEVSDYIKKEV